ncbi:MAG TPA: potassium transporter TrkH, partial [Rhodospirillaceae bacterium]|nr:potassium transporter TrkH [Rhodospirillaceae bacterium]
MSVLAVAMCVPAIVDVVHDHQEWLVFAASAGVTLFAGQVLLLANHQACRQALSVRQMFLLALGGWLSVSLAAALPFAFSGQHMSATDAWFEAVSGVTATAATVLHGLDHAPPGLLMWRALLQWLGGMGVLVMATIVLPQLSIGGMQIFRIETSGHV